MKLKMKTKATSNEQWKKGKSKDKAIMWAENRHLCRVPLIAAE